MRRRRRLRRARALPGRPDLRRDPAPDAAARGDRDGCVWEPGNGRTGDVGGQRGRRFAGNDGIHDRARMRFRRRTPRPGRWADERRYRYRHGDVGVAPPASPSHIPSSTAIASILATNLTFAAQLSSVTAGALPSPVDSAGAQRRWRSRHLVHRLRQTLSRSAPAPAATRGTRRRDDGQRDRRRGDPSPTTRSTRRARGYTLSMASASGLPSDHLGPRSA